MGHILLGWDLSNKRDFTAIACPACRSRKRAGFMYCIVGAMHVPYDEAPKDITWPLICEACGYQSGGIPANPVPEPIAKGLDQK